MKTLKDEIVEALRDAAPYLDEKSEATINKLAAKVESARCEDCAHWLPPTKAGESFLSDVCTRANNGPTDYGPTFGCWHFEPKEK